MLRLNRWIAVVLTACIMINTIPVHTFAETLAEEPSASVETVEDVQKYNAQTPEEGTAPLETETVSSPGQEDQEEQPPAEETEPTQEASAPTEESEPQETESTVPPETVEEELVETLVVDGEPALTAEGTIPKIDDTFADSFIDVLNRENITATIAKDEQGGITLTINEGQGRILELLSQQPQTADSNYQNWNIHFSSTGNVTLTDDFGGLGDPNCPFKGKFTGQSITIQSSQTIFKALDAQAVLNNVKIAWTGSADSPILTKKLVTDNDTHTVDMPLASASNFSPYIGQLIGGTELVKLPALDYSAVKASPSVEYQGDVGIVCGRMADGTKLQVETLQLPEGVDLALSGEGNVGSLVGSMGEGAKLTISQSLTLNATLQGKNVGGLVGSMSTGAIIEGTSVSVSAVLTATEAAGGIAGVVDTAAAPLDANMNVELQSVKANGTQNSGVLYGACTVTGAFDPLTGVSFAENAVREVSGAGSCGGVVGTLTLTESGSCTLSGVESQNLEISTSLTSAANTTAYGGVAGTLRGARANALIVKNCTITSNIVVGTDPENYPKYLGGIVAKQATVEQAAVEQAAATLDTKDSTVKVYSPKTAKATDYGFGGVTAYLDDNALLIADGMKVYTDSYSANPGGGGVVGSAHKGSIVYLKNSLDLSECQLSTNATSGQIVGSQDCSLIYAPGVAITRLQTDEYKGMEIDDIGNYGELYRLADFLTVGERYSTSLPKLIGNESGYTLSSVQDYACLALAWQSRGYFPTVNGITNSNWSDLKNSTIQLGRNINMTGCGIGGLSRDVYDSKNPDLDAFAGVFDGGNYTFTLDIGAENQANTPKVSKGDGRIYWHNATGLFAAISGGATVQNLTLGGNVRLSNSKFSPLYSGGLAALLSDGTITNVSTEVTFDVLCNGGNVLYLGGLIGLVSNTGLTIPGIRLGTGTSLAATVNVSHSGNGSYNHIGGAIGAIAADGNVELICEEATLDGSIEYKNTPSNIYAGGLVGTIFPRSSGSRTIKLNNLTVDGFSLTGSASERMGGILGGIWADTDVTVDGLSVSHATLTANGTAALGGLVYRASGKWTVSSADLSGLTIDAGSAKALGVLVCQGGPYKEPINGDKNIDGLYLEMSEHWDWNAETKKGYKVPSILTFGSGVFDEFVAYTAYADRSSNTPDYQITANGSGIISLKTANGTVNMTEGERNTYVNRTTIGQSKQTNPYSRYYYNLPDVLGKCKNSVYAGGEGIDTADKLLIWSVYRYAASNLESYFEIPSVTSGTIGGTSATGRASFDMNGLSYYPINITNADVTVQYADVKFYNSFIEANENTDPTNKSTRGSLTDHSQHYTMHCALFLNFTAEKITKAENYTMTVNGVTFAGTVGVVSGGSGALVCGSVAGETRGGNTSICTVILADADEAKKAVSLNELSVAPVGDYTPVLINTFGSYAGLKANYVTTEQATTAGSSLIGNVGGQGATGVSIAFAGTIKLPETGVFTKATLLNSLRYNSGSATYNFYKSKDYVGDTYVHNATHGKELSTTVEYAGKQGCYYDGYGEGYFVSQNKSFDSQNDFRTYLPYVAFSPATGDATHTLASGWHEIAVNVLSDDITDGCGTYGHPYKVNGNLLKQVADYINTGTASNGWQVRISTDDEYHTTETGHDVLLIYTEDGWKEGENAYAAKDVRKYLQSAYYVITEDIELANFNGIGASTDWAFTGVIKGQTQKNGNNPTVTLSGGSTAFIKYSYGSVVRDLNIALDQSLSLKWVSQQTTSTRVAEQAPSTFFGGVIGCVLGGDNIIENVSVSGGTSVTVNSMDTKGHLVPMGGYVGVIAGGGVIFRGNCTNNAGIAGTELYRNPIIGRVLGGYAFYEGTGSAPDNGDKNYKINTLSGTSHLSWNNSTKTVTVNNAQGLLVLSAIVSSGAGSTSSIAYTKGTVRNAYYNHIGEATEPADYTTAKKDAGTVWENSQVPYLLRTYAGYTDTASICSTDITGIDVKFANTTFNMTGYGNGYRGLSARYVSNAAFVTQKGTNIVDASAVVMRVKTFDGQNATVSGINMDAKEYNDDDFHMASMGGIFNIVWTGKQSGGGGVGSNFAQNLTLTNCNVSLKYVDSTGVEQNEADINTFSNEDGRRAVSVGGFIGMANDVDATQGSINHNYLFTNIHIKGNNNDLRCSVYGPNSAGGLIGTTAMTSTGVTGYPGKLLANGKWALFGPSFLNCSYSNINVTGGLAAGGLIGDAYANSSGTVPNFYGLGLAYSSGSFKSYTSCTVTDENLIVGQNATITARAKGSIAGGLFGGAGMRVGVNDPEANSKSGISIASSHAMAPLCIQNVTIQVSTTAYDPGSADRPDNSLENAYAAGIIGRIGNVNPSCFYDINISGGSVTSELASSSYVGGMQGSGYTNSAISVQRCQITDFNISGKNAGGLLGSGRDAEGFSLSVSDCKLENCTINGDTCAGGLVGFAKSRYNLSNILLKNTSITGGKTGRLFGSMNFDKTFYVYAAGISVYADKERVTIPAQDGAYGNNTYVGYIAYADYAGTETAVDGKQAPYVTVNPNFKLNGTNKLLTGDAVGKIENDTYGSVAARIWADNLTDATGKKNLASYPKAAAIVNTKGKAAPEISTFGAIQGSGPELPVLVLKGGDASVIEDYLNVITNGGYSEAKVNPTVSVYYYDKGSNTFAQDPERLKTEPPSIYYENGKFCVRSNSFDNTRNRFSLVEASFTVKVNNEDRTYTVSVPVVVIRELQYNFMSTFSYGAEFQADTFTNLKTHVLESTGNPFTAYLTYQYNREKDKFVDYDWQSYMDDGGDMLNVDKVLSFSDGLPSGTQMILLDCQNGNKAYQYKTSGTSTNSVKLSNFTSVSDGKTYFTSSMAEILGVEIVENSESGNFVCLGSEYTEDATVRLKSGDGYNYYRSYKEGDLLGRCDLEVPDLKQNVPLENYYLVITVPNQNDPDFYINGDLRSTLNWSMPSNGTQLHRYDPTQVDDRNNTESTYQISTGYQQTLVSTAESGEAINLVDTDKKMQVKVKDTITFSNQQVYGDSDQLFLKITATLQKHTAGSEDATEIQFPAGTTGTVHFYIQDTAGKYYTLDGNTWKQLDTETEAASYDWASRGANMALLLSQDGSTALDLSGVRALIKGTQDNGDSQIIVTAEMDIEFAGQEVLNATVPASDQNGTDTWAQLHYVGQISTQEFSLDYSSARATEEDNAKYYRGVSYQAILSMDAAIINQLGINPLQLVPDYLTTFDGKKASRIDLTAALNLANLPDIEGVLSTTDSITFTLSLQRRNGGRYEDVTNPSHYIAFDSGEVTLTGWTWTIPKEEYYDGRIVTTSIFDGTQFTIPLTAYVFTSQKDYANYKISLTTTFQNTNDTEAYVVYTFACIKPSFYDIWSIT